MSQAVRRSTRRATSSRASNSSPVVKKRQKLSASASSSALSSGVGEANGEFSGIEARPESAHDEVKIDPKKTRSKKSKDPSPGNYPRITNEWKFGAHVSAAGGVENAIVNAAEIGQVL